ncbi:MAG TPA: MBL fold metallo-hydrolase [Gaiellaceae bacterium]|nr:MBL fold metallo-hydrolase [Gaiellaceae bacterium]
MNHADLVEVAPGVHAAIAKEDRGAVGNAAIVAAGGETLVVDTHYSPAAARELRGAAEEVTGLPVSHVLNTHWHSDHVLGNAQFAAATIVSTARTRGLMATVGVERLALQKEAFDAGLDAELERLRAEGDEEGAALLGQGADEQRAVKHRLPDETFEDGWELGGARALTLGGGHTESDAFVLAPGARVLVAGDLVFAGLPPWAGHGDPREWATILERLLELDWDACVPGHGPVCGREALPPLRDYLLALDEAARSHEPEPELPARFLGWGHEEMWGRNVGALRER